jgi:small subunit ribosomal protein S4
MVKLAAALLVALRAANPISRASCAPSRKRGGYMAPWNASSQQRRGLPGLNLLQILESRLDNVVFRLGFATSRAQARLLVTHGHFTVNGRRTDVPSVLLDSGDIVQVRDGSRQAAYFKELGDLAEKRNFPAWLNRDLKSLTGTVQRLPERAEIDGNLNEQLIVEFYSR